MTSRTPLPALEAAEGPSRELDALIWDALGLVDEQHCKQWCRMDGRTDLTRDSFLRAWAPNFTSSIDAALTLLPKDTAWWDVRKRCDEKSAMRNFGCSHGIFAATVGLKLNWGDAGFHGQADTAALAICLAALRARAAAGGENG